MIVVPSALWVDSRQTQYDHLDAFWQFVDSWQTSFVFLAHHHALILAERTLSEPQGHQGDSQRVAIYRRRNLNLAVNHVVIHLRCCIGRGTRLCGLMHIFIVTYHT